GQEHDDLLVAEPRGVVEAAQVLEAPGDHPDLLGELARRGDLEGLAGDVADASRDLEQVLVKRRAVLAHEDRVVALDRHDGHGTRVAHDVALEALTVRRYELADDELEHAALVHRSLGTAREPRVLAHRRVTARAA